ncbi:MAG: hypothetical protein ACXVNN_09085 [Bacteroidia bacterium]
MKKIFIVVLIFITSKGISQNFTADITNAKTSYGAGKLGDAHFALQQAMQEIDMIIGKEVLKQLPQKMDAFTANSKDDNVTSTVGFVGTTIHRSYGPADDVDLSIISNSPMVATLNAFLNTPLLGGMMSKNGDNKIIKVQGYKGQLTRDTNSNGQTNYTIQLPIGSSLITFTGKNTTDTQIMTWANTLPLQQIAKLIQ